MAEDFDIGLDDMQDIVEDFLVEADELIESLDTNLVKLESTPHDLDLLNEIFRAAHTIKGTSSFLGLDQVSGLTHTMEDILNKLRKSELVVTPGIMDLLLESLDILKQLLNKVRNKTNEQIDIADIGGRLESALEGGAESAGAHEPDSPDDGDSAESVESDPIKKQASRKVTEKKDQTIRVDVDRLDALMNLMGELVLGRNSLVQTVNRMTTDPQSDDVEHVNRATATVNYITTELQLAVMKMRMQPVGKVFGRFPRLVRDLARDSGKKIELVIRGEETELDKSVIEEIGDPLVHIIRNSCDHGIESPEDRRAKGKSEGGTIFMSAEQEGSNIIIRIKDDGKGLDIEAIRAKAVERRLISAAEAARMPDKEVFSFIFEAGFSTAKKITDVSGRGVGMDVVRTNIEKLNGLIELESAVDVGTTLSIKLPLTLAIIQGLLVKSDDDVFILPLSSVHETVKTTQTDIYYANQKPVFRLRDEIIPVINLTGILYGNGTGFTMTEKPYIVVVGLADKKLGINIDGFLGQEEVVIKSMGDYLGATEGIAGATILGDGRIRLIVDLMGLFNLARKQV
jgi:two-component system chemotaxis sensor kinase CheA